VCALLRTTRSARRSLLALGLLLVVLILLPLVVVALVSLLFVCVFGLVFGHHRVVVHLLRLGELLVILLLLLLLRLGSGCARCFFRFGVGLACCGCGSGSALRLFSRCGPLRRRALRRHGCGCNWRRWTSLRAAFGVQ